MADAIQIKKEIIMNKLTKYLIWVVFIIPGAYLGFIWNDLPEKVPMHYNLKGEVDRYGNKSELLILIAVVTFINIGVYFLLANINKIDPKKKYREENLPRMRSLAFTISIFLSAIACFILYSSMHSGMKFNPKFIVVGIGLLFTVIGNYFYTIKPNYFAGLRTPWALENEENWRLTHKLGGKLWFAGGIVLAIVGLFLNNTALFIVLMATILIMVVIPIVYSYRLYVKQKNNSPNK
jgi:uncharacterized membrane protein